MSQVDPIHPIGRFERPAVIDAAFRARCLDELAAAPAALRAAVAGLTDLQLDTPYREGGWTVRQVVHHLADTHVNAYVRFKLALTEDEPPVRPYDHDRWAELPEATHADPGISLDLFEALHRRLVASARPLPEAAMSRGFRHPEMGLVSADHLLALYAWHARHHTAQINALREREGWR